MTAILLFVYIGTTNDTSGNPRRGWMVTDLRNPGQTQWIEEGYGDFPWAAVARELDQPVGPDERWYNIRDRIGGMVYVTGRIEVTPGEYRAARSLPTFARAE